LADRVIKRNHKLDFSPTKPDEPSLHVLPFGSRIEINRESSTYGFSYCLPGPDQNVRHTEVSLIPRTTRNREQLENPGLIEMVEKFDDNVTVAMGKWYWGYVEKAIYDFVCTLVDPPELNEDESHNVPTPSHPRFAIALNQTKQNVKTTASFNSFFHSTDPDQCLVYKTGLAQRIICMDYIEFPVFPKMRWYFPDDKTFTLLQLEKFAIMSRIALVRMKHILTRVMVLQSPKTMIQQCLAVKMSWRILTDQSDKGRPITNTGERPFDETEQKCLPVCADVEEAFLLLDYHLYAYQDEKIPPYSNIVKKSNTVDASQVRVHFTAQYKWTLDVKNRRVVSDKDAPKFYTPECWYLPFTCLYWSLSQIRTCLTIRTK
jgi:hypothetical protein